MKVVVGYSEYKEKEIEVPDELLDRENKLCDFCFETLGGENIDLHCVKNLDDTQYYYEW